MIYKALRVAGRFRPLTLAHKEEIDWNDRCSRWSNVLGANRRIADAKSSMLQEIKPDAACMYVLTVLIRTLIDTFLVSYVVQG